MNAGPSFQFFRSTQLLPHKDAAWIVLRGRLLVLTSYCEGLSQQLNSAALEQAAGVLRSSAGTLVPG